MKVQDTERKGFIWEKTKDMLEAYPFQTALCLETGEDWALETVEKGFVKGIQIWGRKREKLERCQKKFGPFLSEKLYLVKTDWKNGMKIPQAEAVFGDFTKDTVPTEILTCILENAGAVYASFLLTREGEIIKEMQSRGMDLINYRDFCFGAKTYIRLDFRKVF